MTEPSPPRCLRSPIHPVPWSQDLQNLPKKTIPEDTEMLDRHKTGFKSGGELFAAYNGRELARCVPWYMDQAVHPERTERLHKMVHTQLPVMALFCEWLRLVNVSRAGTMQFPGFQTVSVIDHQPDGPTMRRMIALPTKRLVCPSYPLTSTARCPPASTARWIHDPSSGFYIDEKDLRRGLGAGVRTEAGV